MMNRFVKHRGEERIVEGRMSESFLKSILSRIRMMQRRISYFLIRRNVPTHSASVLRRISGE